MKFKIDNKIFEKFPTLNIGVVVAKNINNIGENQEISSLLSEQQGSIKNNYQLEAFKELSHIKIWREAYSAFGANPKKYTSSIENLGRMILEGVQLRSINKVVDIYNYISLKHLVPVGGDDLDKISGDITLCLATGDEPFVKLNSDEIDHPKLGEVIYIDDKEVLCRRWNWRECDKSKMTEQTKNVALVIEGLSPFSQNEIKLITGELGVLIKKFCSGEITTHILNLENKEILL